MIEENQTFEEWMAEEGQDTYDEVMEWLEVAPEYVSTHHLLGKSRGEYAMSVCQSEYNNGS